MGKFGPEDDSFEEIGGQISLKRASFTFKTDTEEKKEEKQKQDNLYQGRYLGQTMKPAYKKSHVSVLEAMKNQQDSVKLGSKVWKPNNAEKIQNKRIDDSKKLTKKATAYTLELNNVLKDKVAQGKGIEAPGELTQEDLQQLTSYSFTAKMFTIANLRKNYSSYYDLVRTFSFLEMRHQSKTATDEENRAYESLKPIMKLFRKRFIQFSKQNRIDIKSKSGIMAEKDSLLEKEKITDTDKRNWILLTDKSKKERKSKRRELSLVKANIPADELQELQEKKVSDEELGEQENIAVNYLMMNREERVRALPMIRAQMEKLGSSINDENVSNETKILNRKLLSELNIIKKLAEKELAYALLIHPTPELMDELFEVSEEFRALRKRKNMEEMGDLIPDLTLPKEVYRLSREEAISTESDNLNNNARLDILRQTESLRMNKNLSPVNQEIVKKIVPLARDYYDGNHYAVGSAEESTRLRKLIHEVDMVPEDNVEQIPGFRELKDKLHALSDGGLVVSNEHSPKFINGVNMVPRDEGNFKWSVSVRDGLLNNPISRTFVDMRNEPLFAHEPTVNDLRQGKVSNCWMVAATTAIINYDPSIIKNCMKDNGDGTVTVRLYNWKSELDENLHNVPCADPVYITVDKKVPRLRTGGGIQTSGALWMQILEKAAAFMGREVRGREIKGYRSLWYGNSAEWIFALTGKAYEGVSLKEKKEDNGDKLFDEIMHAKERGLVFNCGTGSDVSKGLNTDHAYTVLGAVVKDGQRYIRLRNPYANMTLQYNKDGSQYRTESFLSSDMNETCGQFVIRYEDFLKNMSNILRSDMKKPMNYYDVMHEAELAREEVRMQAQSRRNGTGKEAEKDKAYENAVGGNDGSIDDFEEL